MKRFIKPVGKIMEVKADWNLALVELEYQDLTIKAASGAMSGLQYEYTTVTLSNWRSGEFVARLLNRGGWHTKDYFNYEVGAQVACVYQEGEGLTGEMYDVTHDWRHRERFISGGVYIIGSFFNINDIERRPHAEGDNWRLTFPNGSEIFYKDAEGELHIDIKGKVLINGEEIWLNG